MLIFSFMKASIKMLLLFLLIGTLATLSCKKDVAPSAVVAPAQPPSPPLVGNSLTGKEFIFDTRWSFWTDAMGDEIYVSINPSNSFAIDSLSGLNKEISIKIDTASNWIIVPFWDWYPCCKAAPTFNNYNWSFPHYPYDQNSYFLIENYPLNYQLTGRPVKVKVKFL